jgi:hypothetical protein
MNQLGLWAAFHLVDVKAMLPDIVNDICRCFLAVTKATFVTGDLRSRFINGIQPFFGIANGLFLVIFGCKHIKVHGMAIASGDISIENMNFHTFLLSVLEFYLGLMIIIPIILYFNFERLCPAE